MSRQIVIIDGGSGAGKTTYAHALAERGRAEGRRVQVVSLDDMYPGWYGLSAASDMVVHEVLATGSYRRWDWPAHRPGQRVDLDPEADLVIEGCGALTRESAPLATRRIWLEVAAGTRRSRALARPDGDGYRPWWDVWAVQEAGHWARNRPWELADEIVGRPEPAGSRPDVDLASDARLVIDRVEDERCDVGPGDPGDEAGPAGVDMTRRGPVEQSAGTHDGVAQPGAPDEIFLVGVIGEGTAQHRASEQPLGRAHETDGISDADR